MSMHLFKSIPWAPRGLRVARLSAAIADLKFNGIFNVPGHTLDWDEARGEDLAFLLQTPVAYSYRDYSKNHQLYANAHPSTGRMEFEDMYASVRLVTFFDIIGGFRFVEIKVLFYTVTVQRGRSNHEDKTEKISKKACWKRGE